MNTVLWLIVSPEGLQAAAKRAAEEAGEGGRVIALHVLDEGFHAKIAGRIAEQGFVGLGPAEKVMRTLKQSRGDQGEVLLKEAEAALTEAGVECETRSMVGEVCRAVSETLRSVELSAVVVATPKRAFFARLLGELCPGAMLKRRFDVPVVTVQY